MDAHALIEGLGGASGAVLVVAAWMVLRVWERKKGNGFNPSDREQLHLLRDATLRLCDALEKHDDRAIAGIAEIAHLSSTMSRNADVQLEILKEMRELRLDLSRKKR